MSPKNLSVEDHSAHNSGTVPIKGSVTQPRLKFRGQALDILEETRLTASKDRTQVALENFARVEEYFAVPVIRQEAVQCDTSAASGHFLAITIMAKRVGTPHPGGKVIQETSIQNPDAEAISRVMEVAFLQRFIQFAARNLKLLWFQRPPNAPNKRQNRTTLEI